MADYTADIIISDYLYMMAIAITEKSGEDQVDLPVKLNLISSNFNFDFARSDGKDFRLAETGAGTKVLNMYILTWDQSGEVATLWFKIPLLLANETKTLYAYWGNSSDTGISDGDTVGFLFYDHFEGSVLDGTKWSSSGSYSINDSKIRLAVGAYIQAKNNPLSGTYQWRFEDGFYVIDTNPDTGIASILYRFYGGSNSLGINFYGNDGNDRYHNFVNSGSYAWDDGVDRGLEGDSYHELMLTYNESTDYITQSFINRDSLADYVDRTERQCLGNTRLTYFRIYGPNTGGSQVDRDWVIVTRYLGLDKEPEWDLSNLYTDVEQVNPDPLAFNYGPDLTHVNYEHTTTSGGTATNLSNDAYGTLSDTWCSDGAAASCSGVDLIINYSAYGSELTDVEYLHYDDGHVLWLNASKLSDEDIDIHENIYWNSTTTSGWACIDFGANLYSVGSLSIQSVVSKPNGMPKNYKIEGSFIYTDEWEDDYWHVLKEGQFGQSEGWQNAIFENSVPYRFYRLKVLDTYGANIALQEWKMYEYNENNSQKVVSKLRLKPAAFSSQYIYFPKQMAFYGSNDLYDWTTLISTKNIYTPHGGSWQEYNFTNTDPFYHYKLKAIGNWNNNTGKICIAEWEMKEKISESYTYRIAAGSHNNFGSIWAEPGSTFDDLDLYLVNDVISHIENERLVATKTFTGGPTDLNVV